MSGFVAKQMQVFKKYPEVITLGAIVSIALTCATAFGIRAATKNPEVQWDKRNNPEPWNQIQQNQRVKLLPTQHDYSKGKFLDQRPSMADDKYKGI